MGNHVSHPNPTSIDALASEVPDFTQEKRIGSARFMKSIRGKSSNDQPMVLKVFVKPTPDFNVSTYIATTKAEASQMDEGPHLCPYSKTMESDKAVYLFRPYFHSNLYDRISTRPFLEHIERKWIAFQIISAVAGLHQLNLRHGDIKIENLMITSWNAVYLVDFASFKPVTVPIDNPADFVYFFDSSSRRTCYLAPERFNEEGSLELTEAMDIFSIGCVIAELFLEGSQLFHLSELLKYQKSEYDPTKALMAIDDQLVIEMIKTMIHLDPQRRPSARMLLDNYRGILFPETFYTALSSFVHTFAIPAMPDQFCPGDLPFTRSDLRILHMATLPPLPSNVSLLLLNFVTSCIPSLIYPCTAIQAIEFLLSFHLHVSDPQRLDRIIPHLCYLLQYNPNVAVKAVAVRAITTVLLSVQSISSQDVGLFSEILFPLFSKFAIYGEEIIRATFAHCLADLADVCVRFLEMGHSIFQQGEATRDVDPLYSLQNFDVFLADVQRTFLEYLQILISDESNFVRKAFLTQVTRLCVFFGRQTANDVILSHIITYLNEKDPTLRSAFFETMAGVGTVAGENSLQEYVLPLLLQSLQDPCAMVTDRALNALSALVELELFKKTHLRLILQHCSPFMLHPNVFLRYSSVAVICACSRALQPIDIACLLSPIIAPFVVLPPPYQPITSALLLRILKPSISREKLERMIDPNFIMDLPKRDQEKLELLRPMLPKTALLPISTVYDHPISMQSLNAVLHTLFLSPSPPAFMNHSMKESRSLTQQAKNSAKSFSSVNSKFRNSVLGNFTEISKGVSDPVFGSRKNSFAGNKRDVQPETWATSPTLEPWQSQYEGKNSYLRKLLIAKTNDLILNACAPRIFPSLQNWLPQGVLMVHLPEHKAPVHELSVSLDQLHLLSCSKDGTVKVWGLAKLHKNLSTKPMCTYACGPEGKAPAPITCLTAMANAYFACGSEEGWVHVLELQSTGIRLARVFTFDRESPYFLRFYQTELESILLVVTSTSTIYAYNTTELAFTLACPMAYGVISSILVDDQNHWLLVGTARGVLLLYDLRLRLLISQWIHPSRSHIHQLCSHPMLEDHVVIATGKYEVSIWNLILQQCTHVLCRQVPATPYEPLSLPQPKDFIQNALRAFEETPSWDGYYALSAPRGSPYVILAGTDRKVRIWKFESKHVVVVCGEDEDEGELLFSHHQSQHTSVLVETASPALKKPKGIIGFTLKETKYLVNHQDTITDLRVLHNPFPMLVTCSRDNTIKLWK